LHQRWRRRVCNVQAIKDRAAELAKEDQERAAKEAKAKKKKEKTKKKGKKL
jgi:hypothetical protein